VGPGVGTGARTSRTPASSALSASPGQDMPSARRALRTSPLDSWHRSHGARMVAFGGWEMPLRFASGTLAEHLACRRAAVVFDVSHLGTVRLEGPGAWARLQAVLTNDLAKIHPGRAQYTHLLDEDGSVVDDMIVWWVADERFDVMPNASNTERVRAALGGDDVTAGRAVIALQGPASRQILAAAFPEAAEVGHFQVRELSWSGPAGVLQGARHSYDDGVGWLNEPAVPRRAVRTVVAGTGYTGEDGVEVAVPAEAAIALWEAFVAAGAVPAGLGARDTLRLEAGLPLHGHELGPGISPLEAGLSWVVAWGKPGGFRGLPALVEKRNAGVRRRLMGVVGEGRQPFREGYSVHLEDLRLALEDLPLAEPAGTLAAGASTKELLASHERTPVPLAAGGPTQAKATPAAGEPTAFLTSGNFSPVLARGIGMCFLPVGTEPGARARVRGTLPATVVRLPFVQKSPGFVPAGEPGSFGGSGLSRAKQAG